MLDEVLVLVRVRVRVRVRVMLVPVGNSRIASLMRLTWRELSGRNLFAFRLPAFRRALNGIDRGRTCHLYRARLTGLNWHAWLTALHRESRSALSLRVLDLRTCIHQINVRDGYHRG